MKYDSFVYSIQRRNERLLGNLRKTSTYEDQKVYFKNEQKKKFYT